jgi:sugar (pentulose or hexulose) kinase
MSIGEHIRCVYDSLALNYRRALNQLEEITGSSYNRIHIIGGGSRNKVLNQMTADSTDRRVVAGPSEAASVGNGVVQYVSLEVLEDIWDARKILAESEEIEVFYPVAPEQWDEAYERFKHLTI